MDSIKKNLISGFLTILVISLLILSGPARAIDVNVSLEKDGGELAGQYRIIDVFDSDAQYTFTINVDIKDGEFLPIEYTELVFDNGEDKPLTCTINKNNEADCDFMVSPVHMNVNDLEYRQDFGYGYGYGSFGYGYGYGYTGSGQGVITYTIGIDQSKLPGSFMGKEITVETKVYGEKDGVNFKESSTFNVIATPKSIDLSSDTTPTVAKTYPLSGDNKTTITLATNQLPAGATGINVSQVVQSTDIKPTGTLKFLSKIFEFKFDGTPADNKFVNGPITLIISYTDDELELAGVTEDNIKPFYFDGAWKNDGITIINHDKNLNKIEFTVTHFTKFTLLADTSTPTTTTVSSTPTSTGGGAGGTRVGVLPAAEAVEETPVTTETPTIETPAPTNAITGAVVGALKNNSTTIIIVLGVVILIGLIWRVSIKNPFGKGKGKSYQPYARYH